MCFMFSLSCVVGGTFLAQEMTNFSIGVDDNEEDHKTTSQLSGYWSSYFAGSFAGGDGSGGNPWLIENAEQLARLSYLSNSATYYSQYNDDYYQLINDIDLSDHYWVPIGRNYSFKGNFYGDYNVISGMTCYMSSATDSYYTNKADASNSMACALFGTYEGDSTFIQCFALKDVSISTCSENANDSSYYKFAGVVAAVLGPSDSVSFITNITVFGTIRSSFKTKATEMRLGGIVAYMRYGYISACTSYINLYTSSLVASSSDKSTEYCVGGIVAKTEKDSMVYDCCMLGYIDSYLVCGGGIIGHASDTQIQCCYTVNGTSQSGYFWFSTRDAGGIIGCLKEGSVVKSCWSSIGIKVNSNYTNYKGGIVGYAFRGTSIYCCQYNSGLSSSATSSYGGGSPNAASNGYVDSSNSSYYKRSSSFLSRMTADSNGVSWYNWEINGYKKGHLNYGFPVLDSLYTICYVNYNDNTSSATISATGTGVDSSYSTASGGGDVYAIIGGNVKISSTGNSNCYFRSIYNNKGQAMILNEYSNNSMSSTVLCTTNYSSYPYSSKNMYYYVYYSAPKTSYWENSFASSFAGGTGSSSSPYLIQTPEQLARMAFLINGDSYDSYNTLYYKLTADIDLSGKLWTPIGLNHIFQGNFNGNGYVINGMQCILYSHSDPVYLFSAVSSSNLGMGLFGYARGAKIYNFVLTNIDIGTDGSIGDVFSSPTSLSYIGGVAAYSYGVSSSNLTTFEQIGVYGTIDAAFTELKLNTYVGGIVGRLYNYSSMEECFSYANVSLGAYKGNTSYGYVGGLTGYSFGSTSYANSISDCYVGSSTINSMGAYTGGFFGYVSRTNVLRSYVNADVRGFYNIGGFAGYTYAYSTSYVNYFYNCFINSDVTYNIGSVGDNYISHDDRYGAFFGYCYGSYTTVSYCANNSSEISSTVGRGTCTTSSLSQYTSTSSSRPNTSSLYYIYENGPYLWDLRSGLYVNSGYVWQLPSTTESYLNDRFPVLSWAVKKVSTSTSFSSCGTTTVKLRGRGASDSSDRTSSFALLGIQLEISASDATNYGVFKGICEGTLSGNFDSTEQTYITYCKKSISSYVGVYSTNTTQKIYVNVGVYSSYNLEAQNVNAYSIATVSYQRNQTGNPWDTSVSTSEYSFTLVATNYLQRSIRVYYSLINTSYKFKGWYKTSSTSLSISDITSSNLYSVSSTLNYTSTLPSAIYFFAVFEPNFSYVVYDGTWVSDDNGSTFYLDTTANNPYSYVNRILPTFSAITGGMTTSSYSFQMSSAGVYCYFTYNKNLILQAIESSYYIFNGWYYSSSTTSNSTIASATLLTTSLSYISTYPSTLATKHVFAKFTRFAAPVTFSILTSQDGQTYSKNNPSDGVSPTITYNNLDNVRFSYTMTDDTIYNTSAQAGTTINVSDPEGNYTFIGLSTSSTPSTSAHALPKSASCPPSAVVYYLYFCRNSNNRLKYDSTGQYWYFEDGEYPQSYVGTTMNSTLTQANPSQTGSITYFDGTSNQTITIHTYSGVKYAKVRATSTKSLKMSDGTTNSFTSGTYYWFKVEPIRWRVSDYGVSSTSYPSGWSVYGSYKENFTVVSDQVLMVGAVASSGWGENWAFTNSQLYSNMSSVSDAVNSSYFANTTNTYYKYGTAGNQNKVVSVNNTADNAIRVASVDEIEENYKNTNATASDMVCLLLGCNSEDYAKYWTRNLGSMGNGITISAGGDITNSLLSTVYGVRFAMTMAEGVRRELEE